MCWRLKQKQLGLESTITVKDNQIKSYEQHIKQLEKEKGEILEKKDKSDQEISNLESTITTLKTMISNKNREIADLECKLAASSLSSFTTPAFSEEEYQHQLATVQEEANQQIAALQEEANQQIAALQEEANKQITTLKNQVKELESRLVNQTSCDQDEQSRLLSLENFVSLVRTLATVQTREDALQLCTICLFL